MRVAGFTFVRNAVRFDYPVLESIRSLLPLCEVVVVAVGRSDDGTRELIASLSDPKLRLVDTVWDDSLREGGRVLAQETDKAFDALESGFDWCIYLQADEVLHEQDYPALQAAMNRWKNDPSTEGLLLKYRHFYGSYDFVGASRKWYRQEVRIVRQDAGIRSWRDAQGFRWRDGRQLRVRLVDAHVYHYGWVKPPEAQQRKQKQFHRLWHSDAKVGTMTGAAEVYVYNETLPLRRFTGVHPAVMQGRIAAANWQFSTDPARSRWSLKDRVSDWLERKTGWRPGEYRNFKLLR